MLVVLRMYTQLFRHLFKIEISYCKRNSTNFGKGFTGDLLETENKVTFFKKKKSKLDRVQENAEYIYGIHPILCALKYRKRKFHTVYFKNAAKNISDILEKCRSLGIQTIETSPKAMSKLLPPDRAHQGIIAEVDKMIIPEITDYIQFCELVILSDDSRWIIPWEIQDPMNLGNILRTAAFFGLNGCLLPSKKRFSPSGTIRAGNAIFPDSPIITSQSHWSRNQN
ncbi:hypothetical protein QYM36_012197 [Artemia franciscana]|uniref:RNA 2-O ribose methyltransferase substrate binding domain-containing protein n=1 Tax=Artemia franciscana TaxID=6661 RepID=A0AA88HNL4_ARTSF|nr:hypothetical protein QYM36_012197 [Artemia franciscana]KAK2710947.1 hypothetical protein QYM36_012197 [Artemia franciscana]